MANFKYILIAIFVGIGLYFSFSYDETTTTKEIALNDKIETKIYTKENIETVQRQNDTKIEQKIVKNVKNTDKSTIFRAKKTTHNQNSYTENSEKIYKMQLEREKRVQLAKQRYERQQQYRQMQQRSMQSREYYHNMQRLMTQRAKEGSYFNTKSKEMQNKQMSTHIAQIEYQKRQQQIIEQMKLKAKMEQK
jgi:hypothetical protein